MLTQEIIIARRQAQPLGEAEISQFVRGIVDGTVGEGQIAAFCMATCLNPMELSERVALTRAMATSGITLDWSDQSLDGPVLDKHSTGGVGDKVSLMLAPIVVACGGYVPMVSGRGLGHTGGTLDKMDSIPGYISQPPLDKIRKTVKNAGCAIIGATKDLAPADRTMYAVRDVTGTVESLDLITASILSKKMAAGLDGLVMDVKFGSGAFMQDYTDARALADSIVGVANNGGLPCTGLMTDMNQVLGRTAGNAIEVREAIEFLRNENIDKRLFDITIELSAELLLLGKLADTIDDARAKCIENLQNGRAANVFERMVDALGGPSNIIDKFENHLKLAPIEHAVYPDQGGVVTSMNVRQIGYAVIELDGGRRLVTDKIDHTTGLAAIAAPGEHVGRDAAPLCVIIGRDEAKVKRAADIIRKAYIIAPHDDVAQNMPAIRDRIIA